MYYPNLSRAQFRSTLAHLQTRRRILFLTTSNRWKDEKGTNVPKSTRLAQLLMQALPQGTVELIDIPSLNIVPCEGNVSAAHGNNCGAKGAALNDPEKNPSGNHRCWASINTPEDELWKVSKALLEADTVVFFGSIRWGQMNSFYQKLIERLTWLENRHSTFGEKNLLDGVGAGIIAVGQNWNGANVVETQKSVLEFYGFTVVPELCWNWQFSQDAEEETPESYTDAAQAFSETFEHLTI